MVRAVERIEQDLARLEEAIALLAREFYSSYSKYLTLLGQAVRQQLIMAVYQVCTQGYPESFVDLSFSHRQKFQQALRQLGQEAQEQLLSNLEQSKNLTETASEDPIEETVSESPVNGEQSKEPTQETLPEVLGMLVGSDSPPDASKTTGSNTPLTQLEQLAQLQEKLEKAIAQTLQITSLKTNHLLQQTGILPEKLPESILEAATKAEASAHATAGAANLLNLMMETESDDEDEDSTLTRIIAINLRLSEIEFADPSLTGGRNQIRQLSDKMSKLNRQYQKKRRERAVAQAEAEWRSSWLEG